MEGDPLISNLILLIAAFLFGYLLGKRLGHESGLEEGKALIPLLMRQQSLEQGYCALCHAMKRLQPDEQYKDPTSG